MERRKFLNLGLSISAGAIVAKAFKATPATAAPAAITEKDIVKETMKGLSVTNFCENPTKKPNKYCPDWKEGNCGSCQFYNTDESKTKFKGKEYATCQIIPSAPRYVAPGNYCATYVKKA